MNRINKQAIKEQLENYKKVDMLVSCPTGKRLYAVFEPNFRGEAITVVSFIIEREEKEKEVYSSINAALANW